MKRFLATLLLLIPAIAAAQAVPEPETITVTGTGRSTVVPDRVSFSVGVQTFAATVEDAVTENNTRTAAVIAALKKAGATDKDIRTSNFSIWPQQEMNQQPNASRTPRIVGYQVSNNVYVRRENPSDAGRLLQTAINAGANTASGLSFEVSDPARGRDDGLRAAFGDARAKAALLASAAGRTLGRALNISEGAAAPPPMPRPMAMRAEALTAEVPVEAGAQENAYTVTVVFELR